MAFSLSSSLAWALPFSCPWALTLALALAPVLMLALDERGAESIPRPRVPPARPAPGAPARDTAACFVSRRWRAAGHVERRHAGRHRPGAEVAMRTPAQPRR